MAVNCISSSPDRNGEKSVVQTERSAPAGPVGQPNRRLAVGVAATALTLLAVTIQVQEDLGNSVRNAAIFTTAVALGAMLVMVRLITRRPITVGSVCLLVLVLFHCGLLPYLILDARPTLFLEGPAAASARWLDSPMLGPAITTVAIGLLAFTAGYALLLIGQSMASTAPSPAKAASASRGISKLAFVVLVAGLIIWVAQVSARGVGALFGQDYMSVRTYADMPLLSAAFILIGLGLSALGFSQDDRLRRWALYLFLAYTAVSFTLGFRGESVFPIAAWLVATARRREIRLRIWHFLALAAALTAGSVVRQIRIESLAEANLSSVRPDPGDGLAEMGNTLHTVVAVQEWHNSERFIGWGTYWAPLERLVIGRLLGHPVTPVEVDPRVFSSTVMDRLGPLGGSPIAESYRSAGILGVVVVMALIGIVVGWLDSRRDSAWLGFVPGMVAYILFRWIRNDFTPVPLQICCCLLIIVVGMFIDALTARPRLSVKRAGHVIYTATARRRQSNRRRSPAGSRQLEVVRRPRGFRSHRQ